MNDIVRPLVEMVGGQEEKYSNRRCQRLLLSMVEKN